MNCDVVIVGSGIVGMTVAFELKQRSPALKIIILDKEDRMGVHASGRNSGVLHCGIYYAQDSIKAQVCAKGAQRMLKFAQEHQVHYAQTGKVLVATSEDQLPIVDRLLNNAGKNGIQARKISPQELRELEPHAVVGPAAIYCPDTAVIDSGGILLKLKYLLEQQGVEFLFSCKVLARKGSQQLQTSRGLLHYGFMFNCAGAFADTLARQFGLANDYALVPFKGIYWKLSKEANALVRANIYPVPDIALPFLGVHLTRVINDDVYVGPTAIPVLGREHYHGVQGMRFTETMQMMLRLGMLFVHNQNNFRLLAKTELLKYHKRSFYLAAKKLLPGLQMQHLVPTNKAGIRPQLVNLKTKQLEMDYILAQTDLSMHVLNAISPAFTSSFAFAELIVNQTKVF